MPASESDQILARGVPLTLDNGDIVHVRYGNRALKAMEDRFGSLAKMQSSFPGRAEADDGPIVELVFELLSFGLNHEGISAVDLIERADLVPFNELTRVMNAAFDQAFPKGDDRGNGSRPATAESPGQTSTTSAPSSSAVATASSGT